MIDGDLWDQVQQRLAENRQGEQRRARAEHPSLLAGLVVDDQGRRLTPSHAQKGAKRYRYYVREAVDDTPPLRVPARDLEAAVIAAVSDHLEDQAAVIAAARCESAEQIHEALGAARRTVVDLKACPMEVVPGLIERVTIHEDGLQVRLLPTGTELTVPIQLKRCGMAMRLVMSSSGSAVHAAPDHKLIALLAKAHDWARRLTSGKAAGVLEIARQEDVGSSYVTRIVHLAFLAPSIVEAISQGQQPADLNAASLIAKVPLPLDWDEQRRVMGFVG